MTTWVGIHAANLSLIAAALAVGFAVFGTWWFGRRAPGYSHMRHTISELGAAGTRDAPWVAWLWFAPSGVVFALAAIALGEAFGSGDAQRAASILAATGIGWIGAALFPCDPGAPAMGTLRNHLHNLTGGGAYLAGAAGLIEFGKALDSLHPLLALGARIGGPMVLVGLVAISFGEGPVRGALQRVMETVIHGWLLVASLTMVLA